MSTRVVPGEKEDTAFATLAFMQAHSRIQQFNQNRERRPVRGFAVAIFPA
jgi:hypothetical protein